MSNAVRGQRLYVNASAASARERLRGRGLGVRKVHSGGRNQAVVIHTAEGRHLEQLRDVFADVGWAETEAGLGTPIQNLRNLGTTAAAWLREVDIRTIEDLRRIGPAAAFERVRQRQPQCAIHLLWALATGLQGCEQHELADDERARLHQELDALRGRGGVPPAS